MSISNVRAFHLRTSRRQPACVQATEHIQRIYRLRETHPPGTLAWLASEKR